MIYAISTLLNFLTVGGIYSAAACRMQITSSMTARRLPREEPRRVTNNRSMTSQYQTGCFAPPSFFLPQLLHHCKSCSMEKPFKKSKLSLQFCIYIYNDRRQKEWSVSTKHWRTLENNYRISGSGIRNESCSFIPDRGKRVSPPARWLSIALRKRSFVLRIPRTRRKSFDLWN